MKKLKLKIFLFTHRKSIMTILAILLITVTTFALPSIDIRSLIEDPAVFGVVGTLLGAVVGGVFSLLGSVWVNSWQQKAVQNVKRKNVIYSPLYDELIDIQNNILVQNPYPNYIVFQKGTQTITPHPQFSAWGRIKSDTRYLEVPSVLIKQMERLEASIHAYKNVRENANEEIQEILNEVLRENKQNVCNIINIGSVISHDILGNVSADIYHEAMEIGKEQEISEQLRERINQQIYERANSNHTVLEVRKCYEDWLSIQKQTIEMLSMLIKQVTLKYEE